MKLPLTEDGSEWYTVGPKEQREGRTNRAEMETVKKA